MEHGHSFVEFRAGRFSLDGAPGSGGPGEVGGGQMETLTRTIHVLPHGREPTCCKHPNNKVTRETKKRVCCFMEEPSGLWGQPSAFSAGRRERGSHRPEGHGAVGTPPASGASRCTPAGWRACVMRYVSCSEIAWEGPPQLGDHLQTPSAVGPPVPSLTSPAQHRASEPGVWLCRRVTDT